MKRKKRMKETFTEKKSLFIVALVETIFVVLLVWWLSYILNNYWFVLGAACITPFLLMSSPKSVHSGKKWLRIMTRKPKASAHDGWGIAQWLIVLFLLAVSSLVIFTVSYRLSGYYITGSDNYSLFKQGFVVGLTGSPVALAFVFVMALSVMDSKIIDIAMQMAVILEIAGATGVAVGLIVGGQGALVILAGIFGAGMGMLLLAVLPAMVDRIDSGVLSLAFFALVLLTGLGAGGIAIDVIPKGELPFDVMFLATVLIVLVSLISLSRNRLLQALLIFPFIPGYVTGCLALALLVHGRAIFFSLAEGFCSIPSNFRRVALETYSPKPMVIAGLLSAHNIIRPLGKGKLFQSEVVITSLNFIWLLVSYLYHIFIKSTVWLWWPLVWIGSGNRGGSKK